MYGTMKKANRNDNTKNMAEVKTRDYSNYTSLPDGNLLRLGSISAVWSIPINSTYILKPDYGRLRPPTLLLPNSELKIIPFFL